MEEGAAEAGIQAVIDAIEHSGRPFQIRNGECNTRCGICGDSSKSSFSKHMYIKMNAPHPVYCQRCGFRSGSLTVEILESLGAAEQEATVYARAVAKDQRRTGRGRRGGPRLGVARDRLVIPHPNLQDPEDAAALGYLEKRLGAPIDDREVERYKLVCCGIYGLLEANGIDSLTVAQREADRINETCVGFISADESYVVFRTLDDEHVRRGGRRYTNYRIYEAWEGSKMFIARHDVDLLSPGFKVVQAEGVIDLMGIERNFYKEERWGAGFVGVANNGASHGSSLRMLLGLGLINLEVDLYPDDEPGAAAKIRKMREESPFFQGRGFKLTAFRNSVPGEKDFGVTPDRMRRTTIKV